MGKLHPRVTMTCERCAKPFKVVISRQATARFCSMACAYPPATTTCKACGKEFRFSPSAQRSYCSRTCMIAVKAQGRKRHGESNTRLHSIWCHMKTRCLCETRPYYAYYGGRGITVCQEWRDSFEAFRDWSLANGYSDDLEIDRRDTNGNYDPGNCRWATRVQQMQNTRKRKDAETSRFKGVHWNKSLRKWRVYVSANGKSIHVGLFTDEIEAARAYDRAARERYGEFAHTNF